MEALAGSASLRGFLPQNWVRHLGSPGKNPTLSGSSASPQMRQRCGGCGGRWCLSQGLTLGGVGSLVSARLTMLRGLGRLAGTPPQPMSPSCLEPGRAHGAHDRPQRTWACFAGSQAPCSQPPNSRGQREAPLPPPAWNSCFPGPSPPWVSSPQRGPPSTLQLPSRP